MCVFCEIINGNIPSTKVYEDDMMVAFKDLNPQAPVHVLAVPKSISAALTQLLPKTANMLLIYLKNSPRLQNPRALILTALSITAEMTQDRLLSTCIFICSAELKWKKVYSND